MISNKDYQQFIDDYTSVCSKSLPDLSARLEELNAPNFNVCRALTAAVGLCGEVGEFDDIIKKVVFQGKELTPAIHAHLVKELGDVAWYFGQACLALGVTIDDVTQQNYTKLTERYKGEFTIEKSENRKTGDI
jgi:NTP pyrophosphatase (non-canonical NTP hydrolase)